MIRHQQFQEGSEQDTCTRGLQISTQGTLRDILITSPVVQVGNPHATDQYGESGEVEIILIARLRRSYGSDHWLHW